MQAELSTKVGDIRVTLSEDIEESAELYVLSDRFHALVDHEADILDEYGGNIGQQSRTGAEVQIKTMKPL